MQENTPIRRDRQIKVDIFMDFSTVTVPLLIWFAYKLPISISDMVQITLIPGISSDEAAPFRNYLQNAQKVTEAQNIIAGHLNRKRNSIYADETIAMAKRQQESIPYKIRLGLVVYNILYGIFLLVVVVINSDEPKQKKMLTQGIMEWLRCENAVLWKVFEPTCNCAARHTKPQLDQITRATIRYESVETHANEPRTTK